VLWVASRAGYEGLFDKPVRRFTFIATGPASEKVKSLKEAPTVLKPMPHASPLKEGCSEWRYFAVNGRKPKAFGTVWQAELKRILARNASPGWLGRNLIEQSLHDDHPDVNAARDVRQELGNDVPNRFGKKPGEDALGR